jgi:Fe-S-cluster containining protein
MAQDAKPYNVINGTVNFNGDCAACRPYCGAVCCRMYSIIALTDEEAMSGQYDYIEVDQDCQCANCVRARELGYRYMLRKLPDGECVYMDGARMCSIFDHAPSICKNYSCAKIWFLLQAPQP